MPGDNREPQRPMEARENKPDATPAEGFLRHLEIASSIVRTWPAWKQEILGGTSTSAGANCPTNRCNS